MVTDLALQVADEMSDVVQGVTLTKELEPESFPLKAQGEVLASEAAVELMGLLDLGRTDAVGGDWSVHGAELLGVGFRAGGI